MYLDTTLIMLENSVFQILGPINTSKSYTGLLARFSQQEMRDAWTSRKQEKVEEEEAGEGFRCGHYSGSTTVNENGKAKMEMYYR